MELLTTNDDLTGLADRDQFTVSFKNTVSSNVEKNRTFALLVLTLDGFENINEKFGPQSGNLVLTCFARVLSDCIRYRDQVFRYGGEQFTVLLNDLNRTSVAQIAERIKQEMAENCVLLEFDVSCSIGSANYQSGDDLDSLFERANSGFYQKIKIA